MSNECEYQHHAIRFDKDRYGLIEDLYALCVLTGSSNTTNDRGALVRDWVVSAIGTLPEVMRVVIRFSASCEGESLRIRNFGRTGRVSPETYIGRLRGILRRADGLVGSTVSVGLSVRVFDHEIGNLTESQRALLAELESSDVRCGTGKDLADVPDGNGRTTMKYVSMRRWSFDVATQVALFDRFRHLRRSSWPDSKAHGPGKV